MAAHRDAEIGRFAAERDRLLDSIRQPTSDERVRSAMRRVLREEFVPAELVTDASLNIALSIGDGQTISQPLIVEQMTTALHVSPRDRVLEIGTGSGYQAAILSLLAGEVFTVERIHRLANNARARLERLGYTNVHVMDAAEQLGCPGAAPYDSIMVTAGAPELPLPLLEQLVVGGRLVVPVGPIGEQELLLVRKKETGCEVDNLGRCAFVPLIGRDAWPPVAE